MGGLGSRSGLLGVGFRVEDADCQLAVGVIAVSASVAADEGRADACDLIDLVQPAGIDQFLEQPMALGVDIRRDMVGDLAGQMAEPDAHVVSRRSNPERPPRMAAFVPFPEPDVMPVAGTAADRLFERQILAAAEKNEPTDRRSPDRAA